MSFSDRLVTAYVAVAATGLLAAIGLPEAAVAQMVPQFTASAVKIKAIDESGYDWPGSDEVYAIFSDQIPGHDDRLTATFGDFDTGETKIFRAADSCMTPQPACDHGLESLHFKLSVWESDGGSAYGELPGGHTRLQRGKASWDDLIGRADVVQSRADLLADLPLVGDYTEYKVHLGGPCGPVEGLCAAGWPAPTGPEYELTYRVTRLPNVRRFPVPPIDGTLETSPGRLPKAVPVKHRP